MERDLTQPAQPEPTATRLTMPRHYQRAASDASLLPWSSVEEQLAGAHNYWIATTRPDGRPHVTPVWGAWVDQVFYFDGIFTSLWARNLTTNPAVAVHLESGVEVVILEGAVDDLVPDADLAARIVEIFAAKYVSPLPQAARGMYRLRPDQRTRLAALAPRRHPLAFQSAKLTR